MRVSVDLLPEEIDVMRQVSGLRVDVSAMAVISNIWRAAQSVKTTVERTILRGYDLTWPSFSALYIVWIWGPIETREIARSQSVSRPTVTSTVGTLERRGFVSRRPDFDDGRLVIVELTEKGRSCIQDVYPRFNAVEASLVQDLNGQERERLAQLLRVVIGSSEEATLAPRAEIALAGQGDVVRDV